MIDVTRQAFSLPPADPTKQGQQPVSSSNVGNVYAINPGQSLQVIPETGIKRQVSLLNIGSITLAFSDANRRYPFGMRLPFGEIVSIITAAGLWVSAPAVDVVALIQPIGYIAVAISE